MSTATVEARATINTAGLTAGEVVLIPADPALRSPWVRAALLADILVLLKPAAPAETPES